MKPILFSGPMVRAILAGTKTQTRRLVRGLVEDVTRNEWHAPRRLVHKPTCQRSHCEQVDDNELACGGIECAKDGRAQVSPYGAPGDRLWVREAVALDYFSPSPWLPPERRHGYRADWTERAADMVPEPKWRPSIYMPRWASRLTLEVLSVRVERLQDITLDDCEAEGVKFPPNARSAGNFAALWDSINAERAPWKSNPWVWVVEFRRVTGGLE